MAWSLANSLDDLRDEVNARWPGRAKVSDGTLGDTAHAARKSDHNPDAGGVVRAMDITEWDPGTPQDQSDDVAEVVAETIRRNKDPRVKYVIWRGRMFSSYASNGIAPWTWRTYTGSNGHFKHVHVSVLPGADGSRSGPWGVLNNTNTQEGGWLMALTDNEQDELLSKVRENHLRLIELQTEIVGVRDSAGDSRMDRIVKHIISIRWK